MRDASYLLVALALPWLTGALALRAANRSAPRDGDTAWYIGAGWFAGVMLVTVTMRVLSLVGIPFGQIAIASPLLVLDVLSVLVLFRPHEDIPLRRAVQRGWATLRGDALGPAARMAWFALLAWLALRAALLLLEVVVQPLYPWDAWIEWATKARVWYENARMVPFVRPEVWLTSPQLAYVDASPTYPATIPLLQVWASVMLGRWDDALMNVPWWACGVAFVFVCYAALRRFGYGALGALTGAWIVSSLPLANVHIALAGYADLPMAMFYTCAALAMLRWLDTRTLSDATVALLFAVSCLTIKTPGIVWALTLVPGAMLVLLRPRAHKLMLALLAIGIVAVLLLTRTEMVVLGYRLHLDFAPAWSTLGETLFLLGNWHLLFYGVVVIALLARREILAQQIEPLSGIVMAGLLFLFIVFGFTNAREWVVEQTTVNRAVLHLAPLLAIWALALFARWRDSRASVPETRDPTPAVQAAS